MLSTILSGVVAALKTAALALGLIKQNRDESAGAAMQREADDKGVIDVQQRELQAQANDAGADAAKRLSGGSF